MSSQSVTAATPGAITDSTGLVTAVVSEEGVIVTPHGLKTGYSVAPGVVFIPSANAFVDVETGSVTSAGETKGLLSSVGQTEIVVGLGLLAILVWRMTK